MREEIIPDVIASDVPEAVEHLTVETEELTVNYSEMNLAELVQLFEALAADEERMKKMTKWKKAVQRCLDWED